MTGGRLTWQNPRIVCVLLLVFLCGAAAGALTMRLGFTPVRRDMTYWKEEGKEITLDRFRKELGLTSDQARQMEVVLNDFVMYYQTLQQQMVEVKSSGKERILQILDQNQREKFLRMVSDARQSR
jgi:hypothetical protein